MTKGTWPDQCAGPYPITKKLFTFIIFLYFTAIFSLLTTPASLSWLCHQTCRPDHTKKSKCVRKESGGEKAPEVKHYKVSLLQPPRFSLIRRTPLPACRCSNTGTVSSAASVCCFNDRLRRPNRTPPSESGWKSAENINRTEGSLSHSVSK